MHILIRLSIFIAFVFMACGNRFPEYWVSNLHAGMTLDSALNSLGVRDSSVRVIEDRKLAAGDTRPPFDTYVVEVEASDLGESGTLRIAFLNGGLTAAIFFPDNMKGYLDSLMRNKKIDLINYSDGKVGPKSRVNKGIDHRGKPYVQWEDIPASKKKDKWIYRYSIGSSPHQFSFSI